MNQDIQKNNLHYYIELLRSKNLEQQDVNVLYNIINTMKLSRNNMICGEDLSCLDFTGIPLTDIVWSMDNFQPSIFDNSKICESNFIYGHHDNIIHAAFSEDNKFLITWGHDFQIIVWDIRAKFPCYKYVLPDEKCIHINIKSEVAEIDLKKAYDNYDCPTEIVSFLNSQSTAISLNTKVIYGFQELDFVNRIEEISNSNLNVTDYTKYECKYRFYFSSVDHVGLMVDNSEFQSNRATLIDVKNKTILFEIIPHSTQILLLKVSADEKYLFCNMRGENWSASCHGFLWDLQDRKLISETLISAGKIPSDIKWKELYEFHDREEWHDDDWNLHIRDYYQSQAKKYTITTYTDDYGDSSFYSYTDNKMNEKFFATVYNHMLCFALSKDDEEFVYFSEPKNIWFSYEPYSFVIVHHNLKNHKDNIIDIPIPKNKFVTAATFSLCAKHLFVALNDGTILIVDGKAGSIIDTLYNISNLNIHRCSFKELWLDATSVNILHQYGACL